MWATDARDVLVRLYERFVDTGGARLREVRAIRVLCHAAASRDVQDVSGAIPSAQDCVAKEKDVMGYDDKGRALRFIRGSDAWNGPDDHEEFARIHEEDVGRLMEMFAEVRADERRLAKGFV
jgi:hypothetical protein